MTTMPHPEDALLLEEAWAQVLNAAATLHELTQFIETVAHTMRHHDPGLAHHPPWPEALSQSLEQRQTLRLTPQGFSIHGADGFFYAGLAQALGVSSEAIWNFSGDADCSEMAWFQTLRQWVVQGAVWPAVAKALESLDQEEGRP